MLLVFFTYIVCYVVRFRTVFLTSYYNTIKIVFQNILLHWHYTAHLAQAFTATDASINIRR